MKNKSTIKPKELMNLKEIQQIRILFPETEETKRDHIATYEPNVILNNYFDIEEILEEVFTATQNLEESWNSVKINPNGGFTVLPTVETRSTMVGDLFVVCFKSKTNRGFLERTYQVANRGFKRIA